MKTTCIEISTNNPKQDFTLFTQMLDYAWNNPFFNQWDKVKLYYNNDDDDVAFETTSNISLKCSIQELEKLHPYGTLFLYFKDTKTKLIVWNQADTIYCDFSLTLEKEWMKNTQQLLEYATPPFDALAICVDTPIKEPERRTLGLPKIRPMSLTGTVNIPWYQVFSPENYLQHCTKEQLLATPAYRVTELEHNRVAIQAYENLWDYAHPTAMEYIKQVNLHYIRFTHPSFPEEKQYG